MGLVGVMGMSTVINLNVLKALETYLNILIERKSEIQSGKKDVIFLPAHFSTKDGLCANMVDFFKLDVLVTYGIYDPEVTYDQVFKLFKQHTQTWKHFSGIGTFPVPNPQPEINPITAFRTLPKYTGEYGELRWDLIQHVLNQINLEYLSMAS